MITTEFPPRTGGIGTYCFQLATAATQRRDQADQVVAQKIANDARLEQERIAAAELEANDNYLANQRVSTYMGTLHVHQNQP